MTWSIIFADNKTLFVLRSCHFSFESLLAKKLVTKIINRSLNWKAMPYSVGAFCSVQNWKEY